MPRVHELKTWHEPFQAVADGRKHAEFRQDDRSFQVGDTLILKEYDPNSGTYSGRTVTATITHKATGFGIPEDYAMLSIEVQQTGEQGRG